MNAVELLKTQHAEVRSLFDKIEAAHGAEELHDALGRIADKLTLHTKLEEEILYPALKSLAEEIVLEAYEEHHVVDLLVRELPDVDIGGESFRAKMTVLCELVEMHVVEEEKEMFPLAERLGADTLARLGAEMDARIRAGQVTHVEPGPGPQAMAR